MPLSNKRSDNFFPLLQDLRKKLGDNYTFYQECVVAIARATADQEDASAWYEQMWRVVEGVEAAEKSHAGVVFLLGQLGSGEVVPKNEMPPPLLPPRHLQPAPHPPAMSSNFSNFTPSPSPSAEATPTPSPSVTSLKASIPAPASEEEEPSPFKNPQNDPIFFTDPAIKRDIDNFFGNTTRYNVGAQHPSNYEATYYYPEDFIPRYAPAADDVETFKDYEKREERTAVEEDKKEKAGRAQVLLATDDDAADVLSQPLLVQPRNYTKGGGRGKKCRECAVVE